MADFHRVKTPTPLEFPPPTVRPAAQPTAWDWLVLYVVRPCGATGSSWPPP